MGQLSSVFLGKPCLMTLEDKTFWNFTVSNAKLRQNTKDIKHISCDVICNLNSGKKTLIVFPYPILSQKFSAIAWPVRAVVVHVVFVDCGEDSTVCFKICLHSSIDWFSQDRFQENPIKIYGSILVKKASYLFHMPET